MKYFFTGKRLYAKNIFFMFLFALTSISLFARDVKITIIDAELDMPLEGAVIRSWDGSQHICDTDGIVIIQAPDDRQAAIQASYPGYETVRFIITQDADNLTLGLFLSEMLQNRELVIEVPRPGENETRTGRSIAISGQEIAQTGMIGAIEDTMASIKLLPGIIATEHFDALPSVRGGEPQDVSASLDGFYIASPYFWRGAFSIFDPRMIESAQLSHGVFSGRYGHTISGLLDLTTKKPSSEESEVELGTDASAIRINLSVPLKGKGGILFMGRTTYLMPIIALAKEVVNMPNLPGLDEEIVSIVNSINKAPFIRSGTITGNYNFSDRLELSATAFFGIDGTGVKYENYSHIDGFNSYEKLLVDYTQYQGFLTGVLSWNPRNNALVKFTAGAGFQNNILDEGELYDIYDKTFSQNFKTNYGDLNGIIDFNSKYLLSESTLNDNSELIYNIQGRLDFDIDLGNNFILAFGAQEMLKRQRTFSNQDIRKETWLKDFANSEAVFSSLGIGINDPIRLFMENNVIVSSPVISNINVLGNMLFNTSGYGIIEYIAPNGRLGSELGIRIDHYYLLGKGISLGAIPAFNPRFNLDFNILKNRFIFESVNITAGTGLFSSMSDAVLAADDQLRLNEIKPARSWTSVIGSRLKFPYDMSINIEGYYKFIFDRMYTPINYDPGGNVELDPQFNGEGRSFGIDLILQKSNSRYWDGWISYSYNWTRHYDPDPNNLKNEWYFPYYHRFHSLNFVLNVRPVQSVNIYTRLGLASGVQLTKRIGTEPQSYPVYIYNSGTGADYFIEKYFWSEEQDSVNRTTPSLQMDMKITFFRVNRQGKTRSEAYFAVENILSLLYIPQGNTVFNPYTGEVAIGRTAASYGVPLPIPSFGFNYYY